MNETDHHPSSEFAGKVTLITGAGRGLGRALALAFAARGAIIAANDLTPIHLDETMAQLAALNGQGRDYLFDVAKKLPAQALVEQVVEDWGRVDILINNAAVRPQADLLDMDDWDWQRTLDVNLSGPFYLTQAAGRAMRQQGGGVIINLGSAEARQGAVPGQAAYTASKMGLLALSRQAALELAPYNIRVNTVCPGEVAAGPPPEPALSRLGHFKVEPLKIPLARPGTAAEVTAVVLFLCSQAASYLTGQAINADGGLVMS